MIYLYEVQAGRYPVDAVPSVVGLSWPQMKTSPYLGACPLHRSGPAFFSPGSNGWSGSGSPSEASWVRPVSGCSTGQFSRPSATVSMPALASLPAPSSAVLLLRSILPVMQSRSRQWSRVLVEALSDA